MTDIPITKEERDALFDIYENNQKPARYFGVASHGHPLWWMVAEDLNVALTAAEKQIAELRAALNTRDMGINPDDFDLAADEIDCCPGCEYSWYESDTNAGGCRKNELGDYCPNDVAETLRALGEIVRKRYQESGQK